VDDHRLDDLMSDVAAWAAELRALADVQDRLVAAGDWTTGPTTTLGVLDLARSEVHHCRLLRWLLDPLAWHGIGAALTMALADRVDVTVTDAASVRVAVEVPGASSRADVVVEDLSGGRVVVIEAKVDAAEGEHQARRLEQDWREADLVFVTVAGDHVPSTATDPARWRALSWSWIADRVAEALDDAAPAVDARTVDARRAAMDWVTSVRREL